MQIHQVLLPILNLSDKNVGSKFNQFGTSKFRDQAKTNHEAYIIEYIQIPARKAVLLFRVWALAFPFSHLGKRRPLGTSMALISKKSRKYRRDIDRDITTKNQEGQIFVGGQAHLKNIGKKTQDFGIPRLGGGFEYVY